MNNPQAITVGLIFAVGGMILALKLFNEDLASKIWKVIGIGAVSGAVAYAVTLLSLGAK